GARAPEPPRRVLPDRPRAAGAGPRPSPLVRAAGGGDLRVVRRARTRTHAGRVQGPRRLRPALHGAGARIRLPPDRAIPPFEPAERVRDRGRRRDVSGSDARSVAIPARYTGRRRGAFV